MDQTLEKILLPNKGDNIIRTRDVEYNSNHKGFGYQLFQAIKANANTDAIAQVEASTGKTDSFKSFFHRSIQVAIALKRNGVTSEDIITPCTTNHLDSSVVFLAPFFIGAKVASLDPYMDVQDIKSLLDLVRAKFIFICDDIEEKISKIIEELKIDTKIVVFGDTTKNIRFEEFLKPILDEEVQRFVPWEVENKEDTAMMIFSSGSTGTPKAICYNHHDLVSQFTKTVTELADKRYTIIFSTLIWGSAVISVFSCAVYGFPRLICSIFEPAKTWKYIKEYKPVALILPPQDAISMIKYGNPDTIDTSSIQRVVVVGGGLSVPSMDALRKLFPRVLVFCPYGQTETIGLICTIYPDKIPILLKKPTTVGWPMIGTWYKFANPITDKICGPNQQGELRLKSNFQMRGYYKMDSSDCWDADGYLKTGDIGYYDEDYCIYIVERIKEVLRYKMHAIPPSLLESILHEHPDVNVAVVIGVPSDEGDLPMALVVKNSSSDVTGRELEDFLATRVDERKKLRAGVKFIDESVIPVTPSGKVKRYLLRKQILDDIKKGKHKLVTE